MVLNAATVGGAVTPAVIQTFFSHYLNRKPLAKKPTAHLSYDEGLSLIRKFLIYASHHTVEDIQRFTSQWVPYPQWVKVDHIKIGEEYIKQAAQALQDQLGADGLSRVGGSTWWQWRRPDSELKAEWIEMKTDYQERKRANDSGKRVMLYVHGGAYFFGSVDEHRYQMQRHARKLKARDPTTIILAGDSAGGGMVLSMLVTMRDRGIPLPAGAVLISPWVDLTHSFPSVGGDNPLDYIPPYGFLQKPSKSWPPPNSDDMLAVQEGIAKNLGRKDQAAFPKVNEEDAIQGFHVDHHPNAEIENDTAAIDTASNPVASPVKANTIPGPGQNLSIMIDGKLVEIKDQIQMYATNQLISHPLVSPILQPSLGGLPPLLILTGGGEMLRDEQIYLAHKASNPTKYPPGDAFLDDHNRSQLDRWKPTDVQLQVWEDLCHVAPTLSFTRPAKYMYRSVAQFGAWALARAQKTEIEILDDDNVSIISQSESDQGELSASEKEKLANLHKEPSGQIGKAGDPLPAFKNHMIRQRVDRYGNIFQLEPPSELAACNIHPGDIGVIKEAPVKKWIAAKKDWDTKFASSKRKVQKQRAREMAKGYQEFGNGEVPPPSALAGRRRTGENLREETKKRSIGMSMWSGWGSKHDRRAIVLEQLADGRPEVTTASAADGAGARSLNDTKTPHGKGMDRNLSTNKPDYSRSRSRRRTVTDENQTDGEEDVDENTPATTLLAIKQERLGEDVNSHLTPDFAAKPRNDEIPESELKRPKAGGIAYPFTVAGHKQTASMTTLTSAEGVPPTRDMRTEGVLSSGLKENIKDFAAATSTGNNTEAAEEKDKLKAAEAIGNGAGVKVVENGEVVSAERPEMQTFVTASEGFLLISNSSHN